jgi:hypothetical protein
MRLRRPIVVASAAAAGLASIAIAALAAPLASPAGTPVAGPWSLAPGEYYTELSGNSFSTSSAWDNDGKRATFPGRVQRRAFTWYTELGWKKRTTLQFSIPMVTGVTRGASGPAAAVTGLEDAGIGIRYRLANGAHGAAIQLRWEAPLGYNPRLSPPVGDGLQKVSASLQLGGPVGKRAFWELGGGYRYDFRDVASRSSDPADPPTSAPRNWSDHATANAAFGWQVGRVLVAGLYGADLPVQTGRATKVTAHAAGPRVTYRVDSRLDAFAGSWHTPAGKNSLHLDAFYAGIAWKSTKLGRQQGFLGSEPRP